MATPSLSHFTKNTTWTHQEDDDQNSIYDRIAESIEFNHIGECFDDTDNEATKRKDLE